MLRVIEAPEALPESPSDAGQPSGSKRPIVFLAGSIDLGAAENWQARVIAELSDCDAIVLNPRRRAWDSSWAQSEEDPRFLEQVEWELDAMDRATTIAFFFAPGTQAPVTMLELGLYVRSGRALVACPEGFWRKGNVDIVCRRHGAQRVADLDAPIAALRSRICADGVE